MKSDKFVQSTLKNLFTHLRVNCCERDGLILHNALSPYRPIALLSKKVAFTMAEILLSLTIIGVVAAITLPSLTGNINERTWNTQRKALYARMSQAVSLMPSLNGYGVSGGIGSGSNTITDIAAEAFLTAGLSKVLKINNICDAEHIADCGISSNYTTMNGSLKTWSSAPTVSELNGDILDLTGVPNTSAAAFETANGESILTFYNPYCTSDSEGNVWHYSHEKLCANFVYDLNGTKGPNTVGKDIGFISVFYPYDSNVVAPTPLATVAGTSSQTNAGALCKNQDAESRLPNRDELSSMYYNRELIRLEADDYWSGSIISSGEAWYQAYGPGGRAPAARSTSYTVWCVKR